MNDLFSSSMYAKEIQSRTRQDQIDWICEKIGVNPVYMKSIRGGDVWVSEILREMVARRNYDLDALAREIDRPISPEDAKRISNTLDVLIDRIEHGGSTVMDDMMMYLRICRMSSKDMVK